MFNIYGNWEKAKQEFDGLTFPDREGVEIDKGEFYRAGRNINLLKSYELYFKPIEGCKVVGYYNYCEVSKDVRNRKIIIYNGEKNTCVVKVFTKHKEDIIF